jgi:hypothetical protein
MTNNNVSRCEHTVLYGDSTYIEYFIIFNRIFNVNVLTC